MASGTRLSTAVGVGDLIVTAQGTFDAAVMKAAGSFLVGISGTQDAYVFVPIGGDATYGLHVDVKRLAVTFGAGAVAATTPRMTHASDDPAVTALQIMDDWDDTDRCKVSGIGKTVAGTVTRPANGDAYVSGDSVTDTGGAAITFDGCGRVAGGTGFIVGATLIDSANQATKPVTELWIFKGSDPPTADADNAVFTPTDAELANLVCIIEFPTAFVGDAQAGASGNCVIPGRIAGQQGPVRFKCDVANDDLYGLMPIRNAYTPVSGEVFTVLLQIDQD